MDAVPDTSKTAVPSKCQKHLTKRHGVTTQKTHIFSKTSVTTSALSLLIFSDNCDIFRTMTEFLVHQNHYQKLKDVFSQVGIVMDIILNY